VGDEILYAIGQMLQEPLRDEDIVARWWGNEFMVLLPTANSEAAVNIAERLRTKATEIEMQAQGDRLRISLSVGVASIDKCTGVDDLMSTAENGLYQAKHMGRDMVVVGWRLTALGVAIAICRMVIDQPHSLHMGVADSATKKFKPTLFHIFANAV
jgi:PleD family two-component response regulator